MAAQLLKSLSRARTFLVLAVLVIVCGCRTTGQKQEITVATVKSDIAAHLPIGSSRADVLAYLNQRQIWHASDQPSGEVAWIRRVKMTGMVRTDIEIEFKFDDSDSKLINYSVQEECTGP